MIAPPGGARRADGAGSARKRRGKFRSIAWMRPRAVASARGPASALELAT